MAPDVPTSPTPATCAPRTWTAPRVTELAKLTKLTLASAIGGGGGTGGGGSTVFGLLLAVSLLAGCSANDAGEPTLPSMPSAVAAVECSGNVQEHRITCALPMAATSQEILGGQGTRVALTSSNVTYDGADLFTFFVDVQNLSNQTLGFDGTNTTGVRVFFETEPVVTGGTGSISVGEDSTGTFTALNQSYYVMTTGPLNPQWHSGPVLWTFHIDPTVTTFTFSVLVAADVPDVGGILRWRPVTGRTSYRMAAVASTSANDMLAVGAQGAALRWNGSEWRPMTSPEDVDFKAVAALGDGNYIAVGTGGRVYRTYGNVWKTLYQETNGNELRALWVKDSLNFVAVGKFGAIVVCAGGGFTQGPAALGDHFMSVTANSSFNTIVALTEGNTLYQSPGDENLVNIGGVNGLAGGVLFDRHDDLLWAYFDSDESTTLIMRGADTLLAEPSGFYWFRKLVQLAGDEVAFVSFDLTTQWSYVNKIDVNFPGGAFGISDALGYEIRDFAVASADQSQFVATQVDFNEDLYRWTGAAWLVDQPSVGGGPTDIWGIGDTAFVVDGTGLVGRMVNGIITPLTPLSGAKRIWGLSSTELYVADDTLVWTGDGTGAWAPEVQFDPAGDIQDIWGDTTSGSLVVVAGTGEIHFRVGGIWSRNDIAQHPVTVWGCNSNAAWIGTSEGFVWYWDGTAVGPDFPYWTAGFPPHDNTAVTGTSCSDVWATGHNHTEHWDGTAWSTVVFGLNVPVLAPRKPGWTYLLSGTAGNDYNIDSTGLGSRQMYIPTQERMIRSAWTLDNGELLVAGDRFLFRGMR